MIARTTARSLAWVPRSRTNRESILSASIGSEFRCEKTIQVRKDSVAGAEVVDGDLDADVLQFALTGQIVWAGVVVKEIAGGARSANPATGAVVRR